MIREVLEKDINEIMNVWSMSNKKAHYFISSQYWDDTYEFMKNKTLRLSNNYLYEDNGDIVGFISIYKNKIINGIFVAHEKQCKGIGKKLLKHAKEKYNKLFITVYSENFNAVNFLRRNGFEIKFVEVNEDSRLEEVFMEWNR